MPKELTHWWLADQALEQLPPESHVRTLLMADRPAYLCGAVLPDTLLHLVVGPWSATALRLARVFHEPAGSCYTPLVRFVEQQGHRPGIKSQETVPCPLLPPASIACLLGIAAHLEADIVFHPCICALSGDDLGRHYQLETWLDLWLLQQGARPPVWRLQELLSEKTSDLAVSVAQAVFDPERELPADAVRQSLQLHRRIQAMYGSPGWQLMARCLALLPLASLRSRQKLFYPLRWKQGRTPDWPVSWQDPATGESRHDTPEELAIQAKERIGELLQRVDEAGLLTALKERS